MEIFEYAVRNKLRFPYKGSISVEDLWDLNLEALDSVFKTLNAEKRKTEEESLLAKPTKADESLTVQLDIIRHIVTVKQDEARARMESKQRKERNDHIKALIAEKQNEALAGKSIEELQAMLDD